MTDATSAARSAERAADRAKFLQPPAPTRSIDADPVPLDGTDSAVAAWAADPGQQLLLAQFCAWCAETPAELIERIFDREAYEYRRRDHYREQILEFCAAGGGTWEEQTARGDVVRGFFHANGHTIARPKPAWMIWAQMP
ncbi:MAG: hypothetical protein ACT4QG_10215 [Sporichthyaceae bacterium]